MEMIGMGSIRVWVQDNLKIVTGPGIDTLKPVRRQIAHRRSIRMPPALDVYPSAIFKVEGAYIDGVGKAVFGNTPARPHPAGITADVGEAHQTGAECLQGFRLHNVAQPQGGCFRHRAGQHNSIGQ